MGEKIKDLNKFYINNEEVLIELNEGYSKEHSKYDIHIQSKSVQYSLSESDFLTLASTVAIAKRRLEHLKNYEI